MLWRNFRNGSYCEMVFSMKARSASGRTKFGIAYPTMDVKHGPAVQAYAGATYLAVLRARPGSLKVAPTYDALLNRNLGASYSGLFFRVFPPEFFFHYLVAGTAKGYKVLKSICLSIIDKENVRANVMHRQFFSLNSTALASIIVTLASLGALFIPIAPPIVGMSASPNWVVFTKPVFGRAPFAIADFVAEMMLIAFYHVGLPLQFIATSMAMNDYALSALSLLVDFLPISIAIKSAERATIPRFILQVSLALKFFSTLTAGQRHTGSSCKVSTPARTIFGEAIRALVFRCKFFLAMLANLRNHRLIIAQ